MSGIEEMGVECARLQTYILINWQQCSVGGEAIVVGVSLQTSNNN